MVLLIYKKHCNLIFIHWDSMLNLVILLIEPDDDKDFGSLGLNICVNIPPAPLIILGIC